MTTPQKAIGRQVSIKWVLMLEVSTNGNRHIGRQDVWAAILKESTCGAAVLGVSDIRRKHIILEVRRQDVGAAILEGRMWKPPYWKEARLGRYFGRKHAWLGSWLAFFSVLRIHVCRSAQLESTRLKQIGSLDNQNPRQLLMSSDA